MRRRPLIVAGALGLAIGLVIGTSRAQLHRAPELDVVGDFGSPVSVRVDSMPDLKQTFSGMEIVGKGNPITDQGQALLYASSFLYSPEGELEADDVGQLVWASASKESLGGLYPWVTGQKAGSRVVIVNPRKTGAKEIAVVDILPTNNGPFNQTAGEPAVLDKAGSLVIEPVGEVTSDLVTVPIEGDGAQVGPNDVLIVNYVLAGPDGKTREDTWQLPEPVRLELSEVFPGLRDALTDQRVGSRVVMAIPAARAQGSEAVLMAVDILAIVPAGAPDAAPANEAEAAFTEQSGK